MDSSPCDHCGNAIPLRWERCPHCALPGLFPNVRAAEAPAERRALARRYHRALRAAAGRGAGEKVAQFEEAAAGSTAVTARPMRELDRLIASALSLKKHAYEPPRGHRATWSERARLCVAKLADRIKPTIRREQFSQLLLHPGRSPKQDGFVEVHIWGPMTIRTIGRILVRKQRRQASRRALRDRLRAFGVELEEIG